MKYYRPRDIPGNQVISVDDSGRIITKATEGFFIDDFDDVINHPSMAYLKPHLKLDGSHVLSGGIIVGWIVNSKDSPVFF